MASKNYLNNLSRADMQNNKIKRSDIIRDKVFQAPAELAKGLLECRKQLKSIQKDLGWYPKNYTPAIKKVEPVSYKVEFTFLPGLLIGLILGALISLIFLIN